jgi:hypothetical protein
MQQERTASWEAADKSGEVGVVCFYKYYLLLLVVFTIFSAIGTRMCLPKPTAILMRFEGYF